MKNKRNTRNSLHFQLLLILFFTGTILGISIAAYTGFTKKTLISEIRNTNQSMLELYAMQLDSLCTEVTRCLAATLKEQEDSSAADLTQELTKDVLLYNNRFSFFYSNPDNDEYIFQTASNITRKERDGFSSFFYSLSDETSIQDWQLIGIGGITYLTRYFYQDGSYLGTWISLPGALQLYTENRFADESILFFTDEREQALAFHGTSSKAEINQALEKPGKYLKLSVPISAENLSLALIIPYSSILSSLRMIQFVEFLVLLCAFLSIPLLLYYLNQLVFHPMEELTKAMNKVENGNFNITVSTEKSPDEFQQVTHAFNSMVAEINHLKTDIYERELFNQQLELEKLQLQVKPHFYLNCLNIIYNLAEGEEYNLIQELCMAQVKYFRYMLKSSSSTVSILDEFRHIENYLHIQQLRFPDRFHIDTVLHSELENMQIPPLTLHVFAENVVKHAAGFEQIHFNISASLYNETRIQILITDDGPGFPQDILKKLQNNQILSDENGQHIGISNTIKRLNLYYKEDFEISFCNRKPHGAEIQIFIPREVQTNEHSDC